MFLNLNIADFGNHTKREKSEMSNFQIGRSKSDDFVAKQRAVLESEHVSKNLQFWIDLIFGFKHTGAEAVKATNVFYYTIYEETEIFQKSNTTMRRVLRDQIENSGKRRVNY